MPRTNTASLSSFTRPGQVTYSFPASSSSSLSSAGTTRTITTIRIPPNSTWTSGAHWHETHTEYLRIIQGAAEVTLNGRKQIYRRESEGGSIITIPRFAVHEWRRAHLSQEEDSFPSGFVRRDEEESPTLTERDLIVEEWTDPDDGLKEVFFRNLNSTIMEKEEEITNDGLSLWKRWWRTVQLSTIFYGLDNWPVFIDGPAWLRIGVTHAILWVGLVVGRCCRLKVWYEEYTPEGLRTVLDREKRKLI